MKHLIHFVFLIYSIATYSQTKEHHDYILFNHSSDTIVTLNESDGFFEINTNFDDTYMISVFHIRENKLISSRIFNSTSFKYTYTNQTLTGDIFFVQINLKQSDSIFQYKKFHIVNAYLDNITKSNVESIIRCNDSINKPYVFIFDIFINDKKTNNYEVTLFRTFKTIQTSEYSSTIVYNDSISVKRDSNCFYLSEKNDSIAILIKIGKSGILFYEITNPNFNYGASLYFAVSTNDKKLYKKYKTAVANKQYSELREKPYMSIAKYYQGQYFYSKKHSILSINCNEKCNYTKINYDFKSEWYTVKDLK
ncbi:MAG TPA: hypothetical protein VK796_01290 [Cytophaga sp.]|nr:hypothetical protein [Cytophaga sp.]